MKRSRMWFGLWMCALVLAWLAQSAPVRAAEEAAETEQPKHLVPYVPTPYDVVEEMLKMADVKSTDVVFDLGCGDGRICVTAAKKFGARAYGVDINPERVKEARELAKKEGVENKVTITEGDVFKTDFSSATVVTMYLLPEYNRALRPSLEKQLKVGSRVVSHDFDMPPVWKTVIEKEFTDKDGGQHSLYLWKITPEMKGKQPAAGTKKGPRTGGKGGKKRGGAPKQ